MKVTICPGNRLPLNIQYQLFSGLVQRWSALHMGQCENDHIVQVVLTEEDNVVGYAEIYSYPLSGPGTLSSVYGLRGVWTVPDRRHCGMGQKVVAAATHYMANSPIELGVLWCRPVLEAWYAMSGWKAAGSNLIERVGTVRGQGADQDIAMVLPISGKGRLGIGLQPRRRMIH